MTKLIETEVKLYVPDLNPVAERIIAAGGTLHQPRVLERNIRYDTLHGMLSKRGIVLRLREDARVRLTYKSPANTQDDVMRRREIEVTVDSFAYMDVILRQLGFEPFTTYEKYRTTYVLDSAEIVLDEMPYGNFVEIEASAEVIEQMIIQLGLADCTRLLTSYLQLFAHIKAALGLDMRDLTFKHFQGISVPPETITSFGA